MDEAEAEAEVRRELRRAENDAINMLRQTLHAQEVWANKSLQLLNGGSAVALLAFLGQIWARAPELRIALVWVIAIVVFGLCLAVWGAFQLPTYTERAFRQSESIRAMDDYRRTKRMYLWTASLSFFAFVLAIVVLLVWILVVSA